MRLQTHSLGKSETAAAHIEPETSNSWSLDCDYAGATVVLGPYRKAITVHFATNESVAGLWHPPIEWPTRHTPRWLPRCWPSVGHDHLAVARCAAALTSGTPPVRFTSPTADGRREVTGFEAVARPGRPLRWAAGTFGSLMGHGQRAWAWPVVPPSPRSRTSKAVLRDGSDGTRTRDLRRDKPVRRWPSLSARLSEA